MLKQIKLGKRTMWFLNLESFKISTDSPANKLKKYYDKNKNTAEWGKKYEREKRGHAE